jgi:hypothetical protein
MKKIILIFLLGTSLNTLAQDYQIGSGVVLYKINGNFKDQYLNGYPVAQVTPIFNLLFSAYIPLKQLKEELYVGVNPNAGLGFFYGSFSGDLPVYATMRYGAGSSKESLKEFGAAVGIGGRFTGFSTYLTNAGSNYAASFVSPSVMFQVNFVPVSRGAFSLRADFTPVPVNKDKGSFIGTITEYNFLLMRSF